jgi:hypothetical protein
MRTALAFVLGTLPVDSTFTYQGQLRNAGQLVNGNVDVRFTLWDSDIGGTQIGNTNSFPNYPLTDGRFALGLNFGTGAFNGDQRWVQVEFRSPAGVGQYLTLSPRDKIQATPYALYALNGVESQWDYNPKTQALSTGENVAKVGIGTSTPTALLEVVGEGGDDAVKLPAGSIGSEELAADAQIKGFDLTFTASGNNSAVDQSLSKTITVESAGFLVFNVSGVRDSWDGSSFHPVTVDVDGVTLPIRKRAQGGGYYHGIDGSGVIPLSAGSHVVRWTVVSPLQSGWSLTLTGVFVPSMLD